MAKVIIDTNVIVSAVFGGRPLEALTLAFRNHKIFISKSVEQEFEGLLQKLSRKLAQEQLKALQARFGQLFFMAKKIDVKPEIRLCRDPADDHYLALACDCCAEYLITGDKDLLEIEPGLLREKGISCSVVTPQWFIENTKTGKV